MNLSPLWEDFLCNNGCYAVHWSNIGNPKAADEEIFILLKLMALLY